MAAQGAAQEPITSAPPTPLDALGAPGRDGRVGTGRPGIPGLLATPGLAAAAGDRLAGAGCGGDAGRRGLRGAIPPGRRVHPTDRARRRDRSPRHLSLQPRAVPAGGADLAQHPGDAVPREYLLDGRGPTPGDPPEGLGAVPVSRRPDPGAGLPRTGDPPW